MRLFSFLFLFAAMASALTMGYYRDSHALVNTFDSGVYLQLIAGFLESGSLASSLTGETNFLAHHFQPLLAFAIPFTRLWPTPLSLFFSSTLASLFTIVIVTRSRAFDSSNFMHCLLLICFLLHPTILGRSFMSFTPEVYALPLLTWVALKLAKANSLGAPSKSWVLVLLLIGCAKEHYWIINAWVCLLAFLWSRKIGWIILGTVQLVFFLFLFFWWMPANSVLPEYYGLRFYADVESGFSLPGLVAQLSSNFFTARSMASLVLLFFLGGIFPFLGLSTPLFAAIPGIALIIFARAPQIHHPLNHYLLSVMPFVFAAGLCNIPKRKALWRRLPKSLLITISLLGFIFTIYASPGMFSEAAKIYQHPHLILQRNDARRFVADFLQPKELLVTNGSLQPQIAEHQNTALFLSFTGNPHQLTDDQLAAGFTALLTENMLEIDCDRVRIGGPNLQVDQHYFLKLCHLFHERGRLIQEYEGSHLYGFRIDPAS